MRRGLYIHVPFCASRCPYCDFAFVVRKTHLAQRYARAVTRELASRIPEVGPCPVFETIYLGGGTPSSVPARTMGPIFEQIRAMAEVPLEAEITAEANPNDRAGFRALRGIGINRISLGFQTLDDCGLKALGRLHDTADALASFKVAREAGFENISVDLIFGAPGQSLSAWEVTLDRTIALGPEHISVYGLTLEPDTAFHRRAGKGQLELPDEGEQADMYESALDRLANARYIQYEISSFARPGYASRHNIGYWEGRPYLGVGLSAHSFIEGRRSWNKRDLMSYIEEVESSGCAVDGSETLSATDRFHEQVMLGLRRAEGVPEALLADGPSATPLGRLVSNRLLARSCGRVRLTRRGLLLADLVCAELLREA